MGDFTVDVASLRRLSVQLRCGADELGVTLGELSGFGPGALGTASLDEACRLFQQQWRSGVSLIRDNVIRAGTGLDATADAYERRERDLAALFRGLLDPEDAPSEPGEPWSPGEPPAGEPVVGEPWSPGEPPAGEPVVALP